MIFKNQFLYDNSLVSIDSALSSDADPEINVRFAHGRFNMDYQCPRSAFVNDFKEDFTAFYEKVMKDYDQVTGRSNAFEDCFDAMVDDMTEIDYVPEKTATDMEAQLRARFASYEKHIRHLEAMLCKIQTSF